MKPKQMPRLFAALLCLLAFDLTAQEEPARLLLTSSAASAGAAVEIEIHLENSQSRIAALTFVVEYDASRLAFDLRSSGSRVTFNLPSGFVAHTFPMPEQGRLGIAIYDPDAPISVLSDGLLARIRFDVVPNAEGTASVRLEAPLDAADRNAETVPLAGPSSPLVLPLSSGRHEEARGSADEDGPGDRESDQNVPSAQELFPSKWLLPLSALPEPEGHPGTTSLTMSNPSGRDARVLMTLVQPSGTSMSREIGLRSGEVRTLEDVVRTISMGSSGSAPAQGAVLIEASSPDLVLTARSIERRGNEAIHERDLPIVGWKKLIRTNEKRTFVVATAHVDEPFLLTLINAGDVTTTVLVEVRTSEGQTLTRRTWTLLPGGLIGGIDLRSHGAAHPRDTLLIELISSDERARYFAYISRRDRGTGAPLLQMPR